MIVQRYNFFCKNKGFRKINHNIFVFYKEFTSLSNLSLTSTIQSGSFFMA